MTLGSSLRRGRSKAPALQINANQPLWQGGSLAFNPTEAGASAERELFLLKLTAQGNAQYRQLKG
jgi:hypothetical protein